MAGQSTDAEHQDGRFPVGLTTSDHPALGPHLALQASSSEVCAHPPPEPWLSYFTCKGFREFSYHTTHSPNSLTPLLLADSDLLGKRQSPRIWIFNKPLKWLWRKRSMEQDLRNSAPGNSWHNNQDTHPCFPWFVFYNKKPFGYVHTLITQITCVTSSLSNWLLFCLTSLWNDWVIIITFDL